MNQHHLYFEKTIDRTSIISLLPTFHNVKATSF